VASSLRPLCAVRYRRLLGTRLLKGWVPTEAREKILLQKLLSLFFGSFISSDLSSRNLRCLLLGTPLRSSRDPTPTHTTPRCSFAHTRISPSSRGANMAAVASPSLASTAARAATIGKRSLNHVRNHHRLLAQPQQGGCLSEASSASILCGERPYACAIHTNIL
jgi:hypothetical protein